MPAFLIALLSAVIPLLVNEAERIIGKGAPDSVTTPADLAKHQWVTEAVHEFIAALEKRTPDWVKPEIDAIGALIDDLIEKELAKLDL